MLRCAHTVRTDRGSGRPAEADGEEQVTDKETANEPRPSEWIVDNYGDEVLVPPKVTSIVDDFGREVPLMRNPPS